LASLFLFIAIVKLAFLTVLFINALVDYFLLLEFVRALSYLRY